ncbi:hypothetical protein F5Y01DRAFT_245290 [Xylaria sp. FL0043]|nr:hypothetical protein F5Y01DRAFT_245290 [Xylaria sp. FL0043]
MLAINSSFSCRCLGYLVEPFLLPVLPLLAAAPYVPRLALSCDQITIWRVMLALWIYICRSKYEARPREKVM